MGALFSRERRTQKKLQDMFDEFSKSESSSLLKKYLNRDLFDKLKDRKTSLGITLLDVAQSGLVNLDSGVGVYIPDVEALTVFAELFDPVIADYHQGFSSESSHPAKDWGNLGAIGDLDPEGRYVVSTRARVGRSIRGYLLNPCMSQRDYQEIEKKVVAILGELSGELKGRYEPLTSMNPARQRELIDAHLLFKEGDKFLIAAKSCRFWPKGRGIFLNADKTFLVWCNEEDHLRIISMQPGGNLGQVYRRLATATDTIEAAVPFLKHQRLGYVTFCPTNLGTGLRASVHVKLPRLASNRARLEALAARHHLQVRGTRGEHTEAEGGVYDVSNKRRLGITEFQAISIMQSGVRALINAEKDLEM